MELQVIRTCYPQGTNGVLLFNGMELCKTVELPWKNNQPRVSCIPPGNYRLRKRCSPKFKSHFEVMDVPDRKYILFHAANDAGRELRGCIAPVTEHTGEGKGSASRAALQRMKDRLYPLMDNGHEITLTIKNAEK
ncbi:DUF5675 family protein [Chryseobacterium gotjawalense]|uniref:DUF5675 family protein n=1 Tax=Chryseobacterium gotjawalense TaxID=3042315 RepID=A0ABY8RBV6_9FLAO|nr:DUF5675 family protein [Chryseobacterium sp. wdc7]WHF51455.1 DUF5675 family protein [Chryseobacterium sp. wdc7]